MGDRRKANTLLEDGAIFCIRAVFQASCRLKDMDCFIGYDLTMFPGFLGDSQGKKLLFVKKVKAEGLSSYDSRSWGSRSNLDFFFFFFFGWIFFPSTLGSMHMWKVARKAVLAGGRTDQPGISGACGKGCGRQDSLRQTIASFSFPEVLEVIPMSDTSSGPFSVWEPCQVLDPLLKWAGATEKKLLEN